MWKAGTSRGVLCILLACSTTISAFVAPMCACGPMTGRTSGTTVQSREMLTAQTQRLHPCGRPCCSPERQAAGCCCRNSQSTTSGLPDGADPAPLRECVECCCVFDHPSLPPSDSRLSHFKTSDLSEPALSPHFAVLQLIPSTHWLSEVHPGYTVDLVITLSRRTC
jgi:hypothetical protein